MKCNLLERRTWLFLLLLLASPATIYAQGEVPKAAIKLHPRQKPEDVKPGPLVQIPDNPPPHEGAMIDLPITIDAPDLIVVEVLQALPGRPIQGERLVRPDGIITLGFYGNVHVRGLTLLEAKEKIILHLRHFLNDETLGLWEPSMEELGFPLEPQKLPAAGGKFLLPNDVPLLEFKEVPKPNVMSRPGSNRIRKVSLVDEPPLVAPPYVVVSPGPGVKITIEIGSSPSSQKPATDPVPAMEAMNGPIPGRAVDPKDSDRVFLDIAAYNSKAYYILGDVGHPGRLPWTSNETVMDVIIYAGGLKSSADPKQISLHRPPRGGAPLRIYPIDLDAIHKGAVESNLQVFPGDRIIVGRKATNSADLSRARHATSQALPQVVHFRRPSGALWPQPE